MWTCNQTFFVCVVYFSCRSFDLHFKSDENPYKKDKAGDNKLRSLMRVTGRANRRKREHGGSACLVKFLLPVSCVTLDRLTSPTIPAVSRFDSSHLPRLVASWLTHERKYLQGLFTYTLWRQQPGPLLNLATCLMMTAAHSPAHNGVTLPVSVAWLFSWTVRSALVRLFLLIIDSA